MKVSYFFVHLLAAVQLFSQPQSTLGGKAGDTAVNPKDNVVYVWIPPGQFTMGCSTEDLVCDENEKPAHKVTLSKGFWIGQTPVTQEVYRRITGNTPGYFSGAKFPVETVNWDEAQGYCQVTGMRLPTEAEWEYAARAGGAIGWYGEVEQIAWYGSNSGNRTHDVMQKQPNAWGLFDMLGDVWEWTSDWYGAYPDAGVGDPQGSASGKLRALRGGSWANGRGFVRIPARSGNEPDHRSNVVGFRCAGN